MKEKREKVRKMQEEQRTILFIGSLMCTHFSTWQYLSYSKANNKEAVRRVHAGHVRT